MMRAFITVKIGSSEHLGCLKTIKEEIEKIPGVTRVDTIFGRYDIIVELEIKDLKELSRLVTDRIRAIPNVLSTETLICSQP
jgi:DNA-binding Lrp family transcriptional regulator